MFKNKKQPPIKSLISLGTSIEGSLRFGEGLRIDGVVKGDIRANDDHSSILVISGTAEVHGAVHADHIIINGKVFGPVHAGELLELQPKAHVEGDVEYRALEMHQGATIAGQLKPLATDKNAILKLAADNTKAA